MLVITRQDKEKILFYNNKDLLAETDEGKELFLSCAGIVNMELYKDLVVCKYVQAGQLYRKSPPKSRPF